MALRPEVITTRERKSLGVERTLSEDTFIAGKPAWRLSTCCTRAGTAADKIKPDSPDCPSGVKLKFNDFQQTTQEQCGMVLKRPI